MNVYAAIIEFMKNEPGFDAWGELLEAQIKSGLDRTRHGHIEQWQSIVDSLPAIKPSSIDLAAATVRAGLQGDLDETETAAFIAQLKQLMPWRKGPYDLFGVHIDTEWRSDWKWDRLKDHIEPLDGKTVLDVGCGNGYHCWRMKGAGAARVIGIDPTPLFSMQYQVMRKYLGEQQVDVLPVGIDDVPDNLQVFDTVFSMGVLYHRRSPLDHLLQLKGCLKPGGQLLLETLVIEGDENTVLVPRDRYAQMKNVWFIPSVLHLQNWLERCKFKDIRVVDVNQTSLQEQRATEWMENLSLKDFLDPDNLDRTVEGYPAPRRAIIVASR